MARVKFDETDRRAVIDELSPHLGVQINWVGRRRKWLLDSSGGNYGYWADTRIGTASPRR